MTTAVQAPPEHDSSLFRPVHPKKFSSPDTFVEHGKFPDSAHLWIIESVTHYKMTNGVQHEYIYVKLRHCVTGAESHILTERSVEDGRRALSASSARSSTPLATSALEKDVPADDYVTTASTFAALQQVLRGNPHHACTITFFSSTSSSQQPSSQLPSAADLGLLTQIVSNHRSRYDLLQNNCYWYAHTVYEALYALFRAHAQRSNDDHMTRGSYYGWSFRQEDSVDTIVNEFRKQELSFKDKLKNAHSAEREALDREAEKLKQDRRELARQQEDLRRRQAELAMREAQLSNSVQQRIPPHAYSPRYTGRERT